MNRRKDTDAENNKTKFDKLRELMGDRCVKLNEADYCKKVGAIDDLKYTHEIVDVLQTNGITEEFKSHLELYPESNEGLGICPIRHMTQQYLSGNAIVMLEITRGKTYNHRRKGMLKIVMYSRSKGEVNFLYNSLEKKLGKDES